MPGTISTTITSSYTLTVNPTTITDAGAVSVSTGAAIYGPGGTAWTVDNSGLLQAASSGAGGGGPNGFGIDLTAGGAVTNASGGTIAGRVGVGVSGASANFVNAGSATIAGGYNGVNITASTTAALYNAGTISGNSYNGIQIIGSGILTDVATGLIEGDATATSGNGVKMAGSNETVLNAGTIESLGTDGRAIDLFGGTGYLSNVSGGLVLGGYDGIDIANPSGGLGTIVNAGSIGGNATTGAGIDLYHGGSVTNAEGGQISGGSGVRAVNNAITVANAGSIEALGTAGGSRTTGVYMKQGGFFSNASSGVVTGLAGVFAKGQAATVINAGTLLSTLTGMAGGVYIGAGGTVSNLATGTISGADGVVFGTVAGTVINAGTIAGSTVAEYGGIELRGAGSVQNSGTITGAYGVVLEAGGSVTNTVSAVIQGDLDCGVWIAGGIGTVSNAGTIINSGITNSALALHDGGNVENLAGGLIDSTYRAIHATTAAVTIINAGTIANSSTLYSAMVIADGGTVVNDAGGLIASAYRPIYIAGGGTVTNAGTIAATGANTIAVSLLAGSPNRLIVDPGAVFTGAVDGGNSIGATFVSTLELAAGTGTLAGIGGAITNFAGITFDKGANWDLSGVLAGFGGTVANFAPGDTIHLTDVVANSGTYAAGQLNLYDSGSPVGHIAMTGAFVHGKFSVDPTTGITVACFVAGTRVLTASGEVEVERLEPAARVVSVLHRRLLPIKWIGHRRLREAWPVRVAAGAFGAGQPHRDLWLSPDHAIYVDGVLVPVRYLINGATVVQERRDAVCYFHVELAEHGVLLAEGLPAESYLDTGNRSAFANGGGAVQMQPDFALRVWHREACAKLVVDGPAIIAVRERLHARTTDLGWASTDAPAPLLLVDGRRIAPHHRGDYSATFPLPPGCREAVLLSRASIPAHMQPRSTDHRRLGLAVAALALDGSELPLDSARLRAGWHVPEPGLRWTGGAAQIALAGERTLSVRFARLLRYWDARVSV